MTMTSARTRLMRAALSNSSSDFHEDAAPRAIRSTRVFT
jgi:hypothetical protein